MRTPLTALVLLAVLAAAGVEATVEVERGPDWIALDNGRARVRFDQASASFEFTSLGVTLAGMRAAATLGTRVIALPDAVVAAVEVRDVDDRLGSGKRLVVSAAVAAGQFEVELILYSELDLLAVTVAVEPATVGVVEEFSLTAPDATLVSLGSDLRALGEGHHNGDTPFVGPRRLAPPAEGLAALYAPGRDVSAVCGALTQNGHVRVSVASDLQIVAAAATVSGPAGGRVVSDVFAITVGRGQATALETFADASALVRGVIPSPRPSWGWMTWYANADADETFMAIAADKLRTLDGGRGDAVLLMDDRWQTNLGDWGPNAKFSGGMAALAQMAHANGLRAGLWLAPFGVAESSAVYRDHRDWLTLDASGSPEQVAEIPSWGGRVYRLDPSVAAVNPHLGELIRRVTVDWGFDLVKLDFLFWGLVDDRPTRSGTDPRAAFAAAFAAMRAAARPGTQFILSGMPLAFAPGRGEMVRTSGDAVPDPGHHSGTMRATARRAYQNGAAYWVDADVVMLRSQFAAGEARLRATFQAMVGGPVLLGDVFWNDPPERQRMASRLLPPHNLRGRVLDLFTADSPGRFELMAAETTLRAEMTHGSHSEERVVDLARLARRLVYDVWRDRALGEFRGPVVLAVGPRDAALLVSIAAPTVPVVIATDAHLLGRAMNVAASAWSAPNLEITLRGLPNSTMRALLAAPDELRALATTVGELRHRDDGLAEVEVALDATGTAQFAVSFGARTPPALLASGRPPLLALPGVRVVGEESLLTADDLAGLLDAAKAGVFVVVLPPPGAVPAHARLDPAPWVEHRARDEVASAVAGTISEAIASLLGLPLSDGSGVFLNVRPGVDPGFVTVGTEVRRGTHALLLTAGGGAVLRVGRLPASTIATLIGRLGDPAVRTRLTPLLAAALRLERLRRAGLTLDGAWRLQIDPADLGTTAGWGAPAFDDSRWGRLSVPAQWENEGHPGYDGPAWYRREVPVPPGWAGVDLLVECDHIDDADITMFEGTLVGTTPDWASPRRYRVPAASVRPGTANVIAVRVVDRGGPGGLVESVRLRPHPESIAEHLGTGELLGFIDAAELRPRPSTPVLLLTRVAGQVLLTVRGGTVPFAIERGGVRRLEAPAPLVGSPFLTRAALDPGVGNVAYRIVP